MRLDSPNKALLWRCWRLSRQAIVLCQLGLYALVFPAVLLVNPEDSETLNGLITALVIGYLMILWGTTLRITVNTPNSWSYSGYSLSQELSRPVSVWQLVAIPISYLLVMFTLAYAIPAWIFQWTLGFEGPSLIVILVIIEAIIILTAATWWSSDQWDNALAWFAFVFLFMSGWLFPDFLLQEDSPETGYAPQTDASVSALAIAHYLLINIVALGLTLLGVRKQRYGENLIGLGQTALFRRESGLLHFLSLPFLTRPCPTDSPWRAEFWRQRRFRGFSNLALFGFTGGLFSVVILRTILYVNPSAEMVSLERLVAVAVSTYAIIGVGTSLYLYGLHAKGQRMEISLFERVRPLPTAALLGINSLVYVLGMLAAALSMVITINIFGPLLIDNFASLRADAFTNVSNWLQQPLLNWLSPLILFSSYILCILAAFTTLVTWGNLKTEFLGYVVVGLSVYYLLATALGFLEFNQFETTYVLQFNFWIVIAAIPLGTAMAWREVMKFRLLRPVSLTITLAVVMLLFALFMTRVDIDWFTTEEINLTMHRALDFSLALLPLGAVALMLFTMNRVKHH